MFRGKDLLICFHTVLPVVTPDEKVLRTAISSNAETDASTVIFEIQYCFQLYSSQNSMAMESLDCNQYSAYSCAYIDLLALGITVIGGTILCKHAQQFIPFHQVGGVDSYALDNVSLVAKSPVNIDFDSLANEQ